MATTTNYSWTTPDDTALVKDGAAAIRTLGSSIDTTTKALNPSTTLGDIEYRSSTANTNTRLALGTAGQVLTVNSGATAPEWAAVAGGGMTLLSTTTLSGATTTVSGISGSYNNLQVIMFGMTNATANGKLRIAPNGSTTISSQVHMENTTAIGTTLDNYIIPYGNLSSSTRTNANQIIVLNIIGYSNTNFQKGFSTFGRVNDGTGYPCFSNGYISTSSAITSLVFSNAGGDWTAGTVLIYGVK
jgi:hypothetical protein